MWQGVLFDIDIGRYTKYYCPKTDHKTAIYMCWSGAYAVFLRLSSARCNYLPDVIISRGKKNDASNPKKKRKPLQHFNLIKPLWYN